MLKWMYYSKESNKMFSTGAHQGHGWGSISETVTQGVRELFQGCQIVQFVLALFYFESQASSFGSGSSWVPLHIGKYLYGSISCLKV